MGTNDSLIGSLSYGSDIDGVKYECGGWIVYSSTTVEC